VCVCMCVCVCVCEEVGESYVLDDSRVVTSAEAGM